VERTELPPRGETKCTGYSFELATRCERRYGCWRYLMPEGSAGGLMVPDFAQPVCPHYVDVDGRERS